LTGSRHVYWSWDSFFASFGALVIGDNEIVKKNLDLYISHQNPDGNIPKRIANPFYPLRFAGIPVKETPETQRPSFASPYYTGKSIAQGPVLVIAFYQYILKTKDLDFLKKNFTKLEKLMLFLKSHTYKSGLLKESIGGGWAESVLKRGAISYTNMCYARSLFCMEYLSRKLKKIGKAQKYKIEFEHIKDSIDFHLWEDCEGGFYSDWLGMSRHHHFTTDGNLLAILWDIADREKTARINKKLDQLLAKAEVPLPLAAGRYFFWRIYFMSQVVGLKNYHVAFSWLWLGCLAALVKLKIGEKSKALKILNLIGRVIVRDQTVHEIYRDNRVVKLPFYKSENPWAWGAGMFLYTCEMAGFKVRD
jgi:hypothetical protein